MSLWVSRVMTRWWIAPARATRSCCACTGATSTTAATRTMTLEIMRASIMGPSALREAPMVPTAFRLSLVLAAAAALPLTAQSSAPQLVTVRHAWGQAVAPVYEGFDINPDGSFNMWFGYMNRNYEEAIDLPG